MQRSVEQARELLVKMHNEFNLQSKKVRGQDIQYNLNWDKFGDNANLKSPLK